MLLQQLPKCEAITKSGWNDETRSFSGNVPCLASARTERDGKQLCVRHARCVDAAAVRRATLAALIESKWPKCSVAEGKTILKDPDLARELLDLLYPHFRFPA